MKKLRGGRYSFSVKFLLLLILEAEEVMDALKNEEFDE
jgi:hypothetical protein